MGGITRSEAIPHSILCYNETHDRSQIKGLRFIATELKEGAFELVQSFNLLYDVLSEEDQDTIEDACKSCGDSSPAQERNKNHHLRCAAHHYNGAIKLEAYRQCVRGAKEQIKNQGLEGPIEVEIITKNSGPRKWKVAARYIGNSVDLYEVNVKRDGTVEHSFFEGDEESIDTKLNEFFA
jgi:hypothetical protein|tara:strand:- start:709 stop:1248 length:540 start_codon:yes stop_codon:yes gene_type:complete